MERTSWDVNEIKEKLTQYPHLIERGLVLIYQCQTEDEKQAFQSNHENGIGFNKIDAKILSSFAEQINNGRHLSKKQMEVAKRRIMKYAGQLTKIANNKLQEKYQQQSLL